MIRLFGQKMRFFFFRKKDIYYFAVFLPISFMGIHYFERSQVWHPSSDVREVPSEQGIHYQEVSFLSDDHVRLNGWYCPSDIPARASVLFCHGNGGNIGSQFAHIPLLLPLGLNVFIFDYRGYGKSEGWLTEGGTYRDAQAAYEWLKKKTPDLPVILHGWSLGAAIATDLATHGKAAALINECGFVSIPRVGKDRFPFLPTHLLSLIRYNAESKIAKIDMPVLIINSREDDTVLPYHGERLYDAAHEPKVMKTLFGGHDCAVVSGEEYQETIRLFLEKYVFQNEDFSENKSK